MSISLGVQTVEQEFKGQSGGEDSSAATIYKNVLCPCAYVCVLC